ncbi:MAG: 3D domain-containing protein [Polyangiales bacterium]
MRPIGTIAAILAIVTPAAADAERYMPGRFQLTQYWVAEESTDDADERVVQVLDPGGTTVAWACQRFVSSLTMEGTGRTWDGRLLNWASRAHGRACFVEVDTGQYPWGTGVQGYALVPYRALAVDSRYIPIGHVVELPELRGMRLPDGTRHDGCFVAVDGGGAIRGHHIDLFVPSRTAWERLSYERELPRRVSVVVDAARCSSAQRFASVPLPGQMPADPRVSPRW